MRTSPLVAADRFGPSRRVSPTVAWILHLGLVVSATEAGAQSNLGQWSSLQPADMHGTPIHMALVPGDGSPHHSRVVWWGYDQGVPSGGVLGWRPDDALCGSFPDGISNLVPLLPWGTDKDLFCGTQITLADGRLASFGGTSRSYWGLAAMVTYPRMVSGNEPGVWTSPPAPGNEMNEPRWYPTATLLRTAPEPWNGRVLVAAGTKYDDLWFYGGRRNGIAPSAASGGHKLERSGRIDGGSWDPTLDIQPHPVHGLPAPRESHTFVNLKDIGGPVLFGGRDAGGNVDNPTAFVWLLTREDGAHQDPDYTYRWGAPPIFGSQFPANRSEHTALVPSTSDMLVFGGTNAPGQEFWKFYRDPFDNNRWKWIVVDRDPGSPPAPPAR
jgi:hypothetical protein